jgi:hypothetical protein
VEDVVREVEVKERRLPLLELRQHGKDVVREASRLGHRDVDDDDELEGLERSRIRALSASECAGLPLSTSIARYRRGWIRVDLLATTWHGTRPPYDCLARDTGVRRSLLALRRLSPAALRRVWTTASTGRTDCRSSGQQPHSASPTS